MGHGPRHRVNMKNLKTLPMLLFLVILRNSSANPFNENSAGPARQSSQPRSQYPIVTAAHGYPVAEFRNDPELLTDSKNSKVDTLLVKIFSLIKNDMNESSAFDKNQITQSDPEDVLGQAVIAELANPVVQVHSPQTVQREDSESSVKLIGSPDATVKTGSASPEDTSYTDTQTGSNNVDEPSNNLNTVTNMSSASQWEISHFSSSSQTINAMIEGTAVVKKVLTWINDNIKSAQFDQNIRDLHKMVFSLPSNLGDVKRPIFEGLFKAHDRIITARVMLEDAATKLKMNCKDAIQMYDDYGASMELIQYSAAEFVDSGKTFLSQLEAAYIELTEIEDILSGPFAYIENLYVDLEEKAKYIDELKTRQGRVLQQLEAIRARIENTLNQLRKPNIEFGIAGILSRFFTIGIVNISEDPLYANIVGKIINTGEFEANVKSKRGQAIQERIVTLGYSKLNLDRKVENNYEKLHQLNNTVRGITSTSSQLKGNVVEMTDNLTKYIQMLDVSESSLNEAVNGPEDDDDVSHDDLKIGMKKIKSDLNVLIEACDVFITHEIPDIIRALKSPVMEELIDNPIEGLENQNQQMDMVNQEETLNREQIYSTNQDQQMDTVKRENTLNQEQIYFTNQNHQMDTVDREDTFNQEHIYSVNQDQQMGMVIQENTLNQEQIYSVNQDEQINIINQ